MFQPRSVDDSTIWAITFLVNSTSHMPVLLCGGLWILQSRLPFIQWASFHGISDNDCCKNKCGRTSNGGEKKKDFDKKKKKNDGGENDRESDKRKKNT